MAIALDTLLGSRGYAPGSSSTSFNFTTTAAVASGAFIVVSWGYFPTPNASVSSVSGGGLTWTVDKSGIGETGSFPGGGTTVGFASAQAPSGLASGTTITVNLSGTTDPDVVVGGASFTGVATSSPVDGTPPSLTGTDGSGTGWATTSQTLAAGSLLVGVCYHPLSGSSLTNTPTSPAAEIFDTSDGIGGVAVMEYRVAGSGGSYNVAGTWSGNAQCLFGSVAYLAAAGGTNATIDMTGVLAGATAAVVAPPKPRPAAPFSEINVRM